MRVEFFCAGPKIRVLAPKFANALMFMTLLGLHLFEWRRPGEGDQIMSPAAVRFRLVVDKTGIGVLTFTGDFDGQFGESKFR